MTTALVLVIAFLIVLWLNWSKDRDVRRAKERIEAHDKKHAKKQEAIRRGRAKGYHSERRYSKS